MVVTNLTPGGFTPVSNPQAVISNPQPTVSWVALTQPAALRYNGTTVQAVHAALRKAFGPFPIKLRTEDQDLQILRGMMAAAGEGVTPYNILYDALEKFGEIEVRDK